MTVTLNSGERHIPLDGCGVVVFQEGIAVEVPDGERERFAADPAFTVEPLPQPKTSARRKDGEE